MENINFKKLTYPLIIIGLLLILFFIFKPFTIVGSGERGVVTHFGKVDGVVGEGLNWYLPIYTSIKKMSVRVQKSDVKTEGASKDLQTVKLELVVNWHLNPEKANLVFQQVGSIEDIYEKVIAPAVNEVSKSSTAKKNAEEIITQRPLLKQDIDEGLQNRLAGYGVALDDVSIVNLDFSDEFNKAIEAKQVAEQDAKRSIFIAEKEKNEAQARINKAEGEATAQKLQVQSLTAELLQKIAIEKWNGVLPVYIGGGAPLPFLNIK